LVGHDAAPSHLKIEQAARELGIEALSPDDAGHAF
jgi:hypothetical protein